jgi:hypothetical protein
MSICKETKSTALADGGADANLVFVFTRKATMVFIAQLRRYFLDAGTIPQ